MMFYKWTAVKRVMAELWDPNDVTIGAGRAQLLACYEKLCDDEEVKDAFLDVLMVVGEDAWQKATCRWHQAVDRHVQRLEYLDDARKNKLLWQISEVLRGRRMYLQ